MRSSGQNSVNMGSPSVDYTPRCALPPRFRRCLTKQPTRHCSSASGRKRKSLCRKYTTSSRSPSVSPRPPTDPLRTSTKTRTKRRSRDKQFSSEKYPPTEGVSLINDPRNEYGKLYTVEKLGNVWGGRDIAYVNTTVEKMKESVVAVRPMLASAHS